MQVSFELGPGPFQSGWGAGVARQWRRHVQATGRRAFEGLRVVLHSLDEEGPPVVDMR